MAEPLQGKVKQVLDCIIAKIELVYRQRSGKEGTTWIERLKLRDVGYKLTGQLSDYSDQPWGISHFEEEREIMEMIQTLFGAPDTRRAVIQSTGFLCLHCLSGSCSKSLAHKSLTTHLDLSSPRAYAFQKKNGAGRSGQAIFSKE
jgi:hypothetical protein